MIIIDVSKEKNLEAALKTLKAKFQKSGVVNQLRDRKEYTKPSERKRNVQQKAKYVQKLKNGIK